MTVDDEGDVQTSAISKCRNLSATDKSEVGLLRSRVEEQSHLIMTIKTRADEEYERRKHLQELLDASEERNSELITETCTLKKRFSDLSERFDILATNHEEMIKFKNEYKEECDRLTKLSNESHIKKRISNAVSPLEERISQLQNEVNKLESDCVNSDYTIRKLEQDHLNNESTWKKERTSYDRQIESLNTSLDRALTELKELSERRLRELNASKIEITSLRSEKDKYFQLALDRGKIVEEKQIQINLLSSKVNKLEADLKLSLAKFQSNAAAVDANENVKQSRQRADEAEHKFSELKKEYDAFVLHSRSELKKQTDQNKRLRHMLGN